MNTIKRLNIDELNITNSNNDKIFSFLLADSSTYKINNHSEALDAIAYIRSGFPKQSIIRVLEKTGLAPAHLFNILHLSFHQLADFDNYEKLSVEQSNFLYEFTRLYVRGLDIFGDKQTIDRWLSRENLALGDKSPLELLDTIEGFRLVDNLLSQIEYGFYS